MARSRGESTPYNLVRGMDSHAFLQTLNPKVKANTITAGGEGVCWLDMDARAPPSGQERSKGEELLRRSPSSKLAGTNCPNEEIWDPKPNAFLGVFARPSVSLFGPKNSGRKKPRFWRRPKHKTLKKKTMVLVKP